MCVWNWWHLRLVVVGTHAGRRHRHQRASSLRQRSRHWVQSPVDPWLWPELLQKGRSCSSWPQREPYLQGKACSLGKGRWDYTCLPPAHLLQTPRASPYSPRLAQASSQPREILVSAQGRVMRWWVNYTHSTWNMPGSQLSARHGGWGWASTVGVTGEIWACGRSGEVQKKLDQGAGQWGKFARFLLLLWQATMNTGA